MRKTSHDLAIDHHLHMKNDLQNTRFTDPFIIDAFNVDTDDDDFSFDTFHVARLPRRFSSLPSVQQRSPCKNPAPTTHRVFAGSY